mmetsp:Transcript_19379/g.57605  ORF Transcript_19379/g.57605 Transcript_19379/m.57605 type:complete len:350 (+) Transcript_19379:93-1142(+)
MGQIFAAPSSNAQPVQREPPVRCVNTPKAPPAKATSPPPQPQPKKRKEPSRPRLPQNCDDDEAVERYLERLGRYEFAKLNEQTEAFNAGKSEDALIEQLAGAVEAVRRNLAAGDCVRKVASAAVVIPDPARLHGAAAVIVLLFPDFAARGDPYAPDARLLASVGDDICGDVDLIGAFRPDFGAAYATPMDACVPQLVDAVVKEGLARPGDAPRLARRWAAYLGGVPWSKAELTAINRPSLASWAGFPWEESYICEHRGCGLLGALTPEEEAAVRVELQWSRGLSDIGGSPTFQAQFVPLWSAPDARPPEPGLASLPSTGARDVVKTALRAAKAHAASKASQGAKKVRRA